MDAILTWDYIEQKIIIILNYFLDLPKELVNNESNGQW